MMESLHMHIRLLTLLIALLLLGGCSDSQPEANGPAAQKAEIEKWNFYVDFGNHLETDLNQALAGYFKAFGNYPDYKPAASSDYISDFIEAMGVDPLLTKDIERALAAAHGSDSELDQVTYEMSLHLKTLWARLRLARDYHSAAETDPAALERARRLHSEIFESFPGPEASYSRFRHILNKMDAQRRQTDLREMRDKGLVLKPAMLELIDVAQSVQDMLLARGINSETLSDLTREDLEPYSDPVRRSLAALEEAFAQSDKTAKEGLDSQLLPQFRQQAKRMVDSLNLLADGLRFQDSPENSNPQKQTNQPENFT